MKIVVFKKSYNNFFLFKIIKIIYIEFNYLIILKYLEKI